MFKKIFFLIFSLLLATPILAFELSEVENHTTYQEVKAYQNDFDILVMDFTIPDNNGEIDELNAITFTNERTANNEDIDKVVVWVDAGDVGFQGFMKDKELGEAERIDFKRWVIKDLSEQIPVGGLRIFVSIETKNGITNDRKAQFVIERLGDQNSNGLYDYGDKGIFALSKNNGPTDQDIKSDYIYTFQLRGSDVLAPKIAITNLNNNDKLELVNELIIEGAAKDRMQGSVKNLQISIVKQGETENWQAVNSISNNYSVWNYNFTEIEAGVYEIKTKASDWDNNYATSEAVIIEFYQPEEDQEEQEEDEKDQEEKWTDKLIKTELSPSVYLLKEDGSKHLFLTEAIFLSYYNDFSTVEIISSSEMNLYNFAGNMQMKLGNLIKIRTLPKVYEVMENWQIKWIPTEQDAKNLYGNNWDSLIKIIPDEFFSEYEVI